MHILRAIATQGRRGMAFKTIVASSRLPQTTVHRTLRSLMAEGLVHKEERTQKYHLGPLLHALGLVAIPHFHFLEKCQGALDRLATLTGDTVYLSERFGEEAVTADYREGSYPLKSMLLHVGTRRPLGIGAGGLAILAAMPTAQADEIIKVNADALPVLGNFDMEFLISAVELARERGYSYLANKATRGMTAVGVALFDSASGARAAISVAAAPSRMTQARACEIAGEMKREIIKIDELFTVQDYDRSVT